MIQRLSALHFATGWTAFGLAFALLLATNSQAQSSAEASSLILDDGPLQDIGDIVRLALRLKIGDQNQLELDRSAWIRSNKDADAELPMRIHGLDPRGRDAAIARRVAAHIGGAQSAGPLGQLFSELRTHGMLGMSHSEGGNVTETTCRGDLMKCTATFIDSNFEFKISETAGRQLFFSSSNKLVRMMYIDDDRIAILNQSNSGRVTGVLTGEENLSGVSDNFMDFGRDHKLLDQQLKQIFAQAGVDFPPSPQDPEVKQRVLARIRAISSDAAAELDILIKQLDAGDFETREAASTKIIAGFDRFEDLIAIRLTDDLLALESKNRLDKIMKDLNQQTQHDARIDFCIAASSLLRSPRYLIGLLDQVDDDDQKLLRARLGDLTQEKFGDDDAAWKEWAKHTMSDE